MQFLFSVVVHRAVLHMHGRRPRRCRAKHLTLRSSGHAPAGHAWPSFHSGPCVACRHVPLSSNVRRLPSVMNPEHSVNRCEAGCGPRKVCAPAIVGWCVKVSVGCPSSGGQRTVCGARAGSYRGTRACSSRLAHRQGTQALAAAQRVVHQPRRLTGLSSGHPTAGGVCLLRKG
jgi:hypothetical protein